MTPWVTLLSENKTTRQTKKEEEEEENIWSTNHITTIPPSKTLKAMSQDWDFEEEEEEDH